MIILLYGEENGNLYGRCSGNLNFSLHFLVFMFRYCYILSVELLRASCSLYSLVRDRHDKALSSREKGGVEDSADVSVIESRSMYILRPLDDISHLSESESIRDYVMCMSGQSDD